MTVATLGRKYGTVFSICLVERLTYRTDFFLFTLMRFLPIVTTIFLWQAVFAGSSQSTIAGLTPPEMIAYYLLVTVTRAFSSMPGLADSLALDIRDGNIKKYLIQPVDLIGFHLTARIAHKLVYYGIAIIPFTIIFVLCRGYFSGWPSASVLALYIASLFMAFLMGFFFECMIGLLAFWMLEISSLNFIIIMLNYLLSGHMFPLDLVPGTLGTIIQYSPFKYFAYFSAIVFLRGDSMSARELALAIAGQAGWTIVMGALAFAAWRFGRRRYSAFGG